MKLIKKIQNARLVQDTQGLSTVEYVIILALIAVLAVSAWNTLGSNIKTYLDNSNTEIDGQIVGPAKGEG